MNSKFYRLWLCHLGPRPQKGFVLPLIMMTGLVIAVVGATMVVQGMGDNNKVVAQKAKSQANAAAEAGFTRLQQFLAKYPHLADKDMSEWQAIVAAAQTSTTADDGPITELVTATKTDSCALANQSNTALRTAALGELTPLLNTVANTAQAIALPGNSNNWTTKFRFKTYSWDDTNKVATTKLQGLVVGQDGQRIASTDMNVTFPVEPNAVVIPSSIFPGLWVKEYLQAGQNNNNPGTLDAEVVYDCSINPGSLTTTAGNGSSAGYTEYRSANNAANGDKAIRLALPNGMTPPQMTQIPMPTPPTTAPTGVTTHSLGTVNNDLTLPLSTHNTSSTNYHAATQTYYYAANSIDIGNNESLIFTPGQKVVLFVNGDIDVGGGGAIAHNCDGVTGCDATNVNIIGATSTGTFETTGNASVCSIFFWAPTYTVDMSGGGHAGDCPSGANQNGIYWVKAWIGGGQGSHEALNQSGSNWDRMTTARVVPLRTKLSNPNSWAAVEDDNN
ncbi:MAG: hypothetical protein ACK5CA_12395 [Cyanobacteriota bacterium]